MGRVEAFTLDGLELWFNSSDHLPEHFHAGRRGAWEIRVYFLLCSERRLEYDVKWGKHPPAATQALILSTVLLNRATLLAEWERKVCRS